MLLRFRSPADLDGPPRILAAHAVIEWMFVRSSADLDRPPRILPARATTERMHVSKPLRLADLDPQQTASTIAWAVNDRAERDARRLGLVLTLPAALDPKTKRSAVLAQSRVYKVTYTCAVWATTGRGSLEEVEAAVRELRADLEGVEPGQASRRERDLTTRTGLLLVATEARLALAAGRTVEALEVATLASLDERSIRAAVQANALAPVAPGRPMRFAAEQVQHYLYTRGVPGFGPRSTASGPVGAPPPR
jgi:hypothetical protein